MTNPKDTPTLDILGSGGLLEPVDEIQIQHRAVVAREMTPWPELATIPWLDRVETSRERIERLCSEFAIPKADLESASRAEDDQRSSRLNMVERWGYLYPSLDLLYPLVAVESTPGKAPAYPGPPPKVEAEIVPIVMENGKARPAREGEKPHGEVERPIAKPTGSVVASASECFPVWPSAGMTLEHVAAVTEDGDAIPATRNADGSWTIKNNTGRPVMVTGLMRYGQPEDLYSVDTHKKSDPATSGQKCGVAPGVETAPEGVEIEKAHTTSDERESLPTRCLGCGREWVREWRRGRAFPSRDGVVEVPECVACHRFVPRPSFNPEALERVVGSITEYITRPSPKAVLVDSSLLTGSFRVPAPNAHLFQIGDAVLSDTDDNGRAYIRKARSNEKAACVVTAAHWVPDDPSRSWVEVYASPPEAEDDPDPIPQIEAWLCEHKAVIEFQRDVLWRDGRRVDVAPEGPRSSSGCTLAAVFLGRYDNWPALTDGFRWLPPDLEAWACEQGVIVVCVYKGWFIARSGPRRKPGATLLDALTALRGVME